MQAGWCLGGQSLQAGGGSGQDRGEGMVLVLVQGWVAPGVGGSGDES